MDRLRRALTLASAAAALWALAIMASGGIVLDVAGIAITSRNPRNPLLAAIVLALIAFALPMPNRRQALAESFDRWAGRLRWYLAEAPWWAEPATLAAAAAVFFQLRAWAFARPLWLDEQLIALNFRDRSFADLGGTLWLGQSAPYGWLAVERAVLLALGTGERALRLAPLLFGCATVLVALWAGRRWMGRTGALVLVVLCGFGQWTSHHALELKHYSADAFFGLLLPVLTIWALEAREAPEWRRRMRWWWVAAAVGLWLSYGAVFVAPACAISLALGAWRRNGLKAVVTVAMAGSVWIASFGLHYLVSLRFSAGSAYLHDYWASAFPPAGAGVAAILDWSRQQLAPLALIPGGTEWGPIFWLAAFGGFAAAWLLSAGRSTSESPDARSTRLPASAGMVLAAVPFSAFALSIARIAPMQDRLALWIVPALYFGVALLADAAAHLLGQAMTAPGGTRASRWQSRAFNAAMSIAAALVVFVVSAEIVSRGWNEFRAGRLPGSNHGLDDRSTVGWLLDRQQAGDLLASTHLGVPSFWWYGMVPIREEAGGGSRLPDGTPILEIGRAGDEAECERDNLVALLSGRRRVLFYSGFPDEPPGFDGVVLSALSDHGSIVAEQRFANGSRAVIVELRSEADGTAPSSVATRSSQDRAMDVCVTARPARRW